MPSSRRRRSGAVRSPKRCSPRCRQMRPCSNSSGAASPSRAAGGRRSPRRHGARRATASTAWAPLLEEILTRSQRAGTVRGDVTVTDLVVVLMSVRSIADVCDTKSSRPSLRFLELVLDSLRPGHPAIVVPALTVAQLDKVLKRR